MADEGDILSRVRAAAALKVLFLPHALSQMLRPDRMIRREEIRKAIDQGELVEDYPEDVRGHSCLLLGPGTDGRPIHVVCSPKEDYLAVITAYVPDDDKWSGGYRVRVRP